MIHTNNKSIGNPGALLFMPENTPATASIQKGL